MKLISRSVPCMYGEGLTAAQASSWTSFRAAYLLASSLGRSLYSRCPTNLPSGRHEERKIPSRSSRGSSPGASCTFKIYGANGGQVLRNSVFLILVKNGSFVMTHYLLIWSSLFFHPLHWYPGDLLTGRSFGASGTIPRGDVIKPSSGTQRTQKGSRQETRWNQGFQ